jgi:malate dehydrogenase (oxaloacetate-decarboxylating)
VLAFPGVFRGLLDASARSIDNSVLAAAALAIAGAVSDDELNANYIIPSVFHEEVHKAVAAAVRDSVRGT